MDTHSTETALQPHDDVGENELPLVLGKLNEQRRRFVLGVYSGMSPLAAARAAGYADPESHAYKVHKSPDVQHALAELRKHDVEVVGVSRKDVIAGFMDAVRAASSSTELTMAWREIGKLLGYYAPDKVQHEHAHEHKLEEKTAAQLASLPTKDLLRIAGHDPMLIEGEFEVVEEEQETQECQETGTSDTAQTAEQS